MPLRPREHEIEDESERVFRGLVPAPWVVRRLDPDYGIDLTVQVFDTEGRSTPFSFHVQLKATDGEDVSKALRDVRFPLDHAEHYSSLPIPLLIVRYHAASGELYARWWHAYNPLIVIRPGEMPKPTKTVGFRFSATDRWTEDTPDDVVAGVRSFHYFHSPALALPLRFSVSVADDDAALPVILLGLRRLLHPVSDLMAVQAGAPAADRPSIRIGSGRFTVALADVASVTVDCRDQKIGSAVMSADVACAAAYLLIRVGQNNLAAQLAAASTAQSSLVFDFDVAFALAGAMYRAKRIPEALGLIAALNDRPEPEGRIAAFVIHTAVLARGGHLTQDESRRAVVVARAAFHRTSAGSEPTTAAGDAYNLAKALLRTGDREEAIDAFHKASELDPSYFDRAYYHSELAGVLFEATRYGDSADHYGRALELGSRSLDRALRADALLMGGRYAEAQQEFAAYLEDHSTADDAEWRVKLRVLDEVRYRGGDQQERRPEEAWDRAEQVRFDDPNVTLESALDLLAEALALDACCFPAYQRLAILSIDQTSADDFDTSRAVGPALAAALLFRVDPRAWIGAITVAADSGEPDDVLYDLMITGIRLAGHEVVEGLLAANNRPRPEHVALLDQAAADYESKRRASGFVLRFPHPDGGVVEVPFQPPEDPG